MSEGLRSQLYSCPNYGYKLDTETIYIRKFMAVGEGGNAGYCRAYYWSPTNAKEEETLP